jgi:sugar lactone lactonase YvrE
MRITNKNTAWLGAALARFVLIGSRFVRPTQDDRQALVRPIEKMLSSMNGSVALSALMLAAAACDSDGATGDAGALSTLLPIELSLPDANWFPESLTAAHDGSLFVGSLGGRGIAKFAPGSDRVTSFVAAGVVKNVAGVLADDANGLLYACDNDLSVTPYAATLRSFDLATAAPEASYPFPSAGFCNDMAFDANGNMFITDSFGKVLELTKGGAALHTWSSDPLLAPSSATGLGADGIAFDGTGNFYVSAFSDNRLLRIPVNADGSAGTLATVTVTPALANPDGMRLVDATTLLVAEGAGNRLSKVSVTGMTATAAPIVNRLNLPTSVVTSQGQYWISEGQIPILTGAIAGPPALPFLVRRFPADI